MLTLFGGLALVLAAVGTYGVVAYNVSQRTRELGIRMALGAQPKHIMQLIMGGGAGMIAIGAILGLAGAFVVARLLAPLLIGVTATDYAALVGAVMLLTLAALAACYVPTRRAMRIDPNVAFGTSSYDGDHENPRARLIGGRRHCGSSRDDPGAASGISHHGNPHRKGPVHISGRLPDAVGPD